MTGRYTIRMPHEYQPGDFGHYAGTWYGMTPNGLLANLAGHTVTEHGDLTISVEPSILVDTGVGGEQWHGYLRRGEWVTI